MDFKEITARQLNENPFTLINKRWMLITAGDEKRLNTMTASWGGLGVLWGSDVAFIFVRPNRYTYEFLEKAKGFSLTFYPEEYRDKLNLCGSKSGRDIDKVSACGFTVGMDSGIPYFKQCDTAVFCSKLYAQDIDPKLFLDPSIEKWYENDYHRMYIGKIEKVLQR